MKHIKLPDGPVELELLAIMDIHNTTKQIHLLFLYNGYAMIYRVKN